MYKNGFRQTGKMAYTKFIHYLLCLFKFTFIRFNTHLKGYNMCELLNYRTDNSAPTWNNKLLYLHKLY